MATERKAKMFGLADEQTTGFLEKMHRFKAAILLYLSSMERKRINELEKTQLFYLVIKLTKPFVVPRACTR